MAWLSSVFSSFDGLQVGRPLVSMSRLLSNLIVAVSSFGGTRSRSVGPGPTDSSVIFIATAPGFLPDVFPLMPRLRVCVTVALASA